MIEYFSVNLDAMTERITVIENHRQLLVQADDELILIPLSDLEAHRENVGDAVSQQGHFTVVADELAPDDCWCVNAANNRIHIVQGDVLRTIQLQPLATIEEKQIKGLSEGGYSLTCSPDGRYFLYQSYVPVDPDFEELKIYLLDGQEGLVVSELPVKLENVAPASSVRSGFVVLDDASGQLHGVGNDGSTRELLPPASTGIDLDGTTLDQATGRVTRWFNDPSDTGTRVGWYDWQMEPREWKSLTLGKVECQELAWHPSGDALLCLEEEDDHGVIHLFRNDVLTESFAVPADSLGSGLGWLDDLIFTAGAQRLSLWKATPDP